MTYAEAMKRLEEIVAALEAGGTDLDETLKLFEEGSNLLKECQKELAEAEGKIETLRLEDIE
ncbi:MAG: exodeoxyribonuclease VII small subunit [Euryarchaeota archaeon]|nr:exodeoxyribonuclease VII small subunit [Euryarchaeota archaeon]RAH15556.1 MAG: exodeoxyribonuclease VII small subunit [Euryarchaeota archaeon]|tara:strand:- start:848 stop:1033 length:186 start_codon:yes stop_codon:yes gene_type:complete